jgi:hypothetical protein
MSVSDLFPPKMPAAGRPATRTAAQTRRFDLPCLAAKAISRQVGGRLAGWWPYFWADGGEALTSLRFDLPDGDKTYRPIHPSGEGWSIGDPPGPLPLYRLADLDGQERVYIVEGEKCCDAAAGIGLTATTSAHGAKSPSKTDWRPLAGRDVTILSDNDAAGRRYAAEVAAILTRLDPPATVRIVELPGLPEGGDIVDFLEARDAQAPGDLRREIEALADAAPPWTPATDNPARTAPPQWHPFPVEALPPACRAYVRELAAVTQTDPSYAALALLVGLAGSVGNTRRIRVKSDWIVPAVLWGALVGESGRLKTVVLRHVLAPVYRREGEAVAGHRAALDQYKAAMQAHKYALRDWETKGRAAGAPAPVEPRRPILERHLVSDTTVEALGDRLQDAPRGVLLARDELAGWLRSFNQYKATRGADEAHWAEMFEAGNLLVDRKVGERAIVFVPRAAVSIIGGIQPDILRRALMPEYRESGLAARLLMAWPPRGPKRWTERELSASAVKQLSGIYMRLWTLAPVEVDGELGPLDLPLSADAKTLFAAFVNQHGQEALELTGDLGAAWAKLEGYGARLALVLELAAWAEVPQGDGRGPAEVSAASVRAALRILEWAKSETRRIYAMLGESDEEKEAREVLDFVQRRGGRVTAYALHKGMPKRFPDSDDADLYLRGFVPAVGHWVDAPPGPKGGRPTRFFELNGAPVVECPKPETPETLTS